MIFQNDRSGKFLQSYAVSAESGVKVTIESPSNRTNSFPIASQAGRGPDIVIWAYDKVGEWSEGGWTAPVYFSEEYKGKFSPKAWEAVMNVNRASSNTNRIKYFLQSYLLTYCSGSLLLNQENPYRRACDNLALRKAVDATNL
jgi:hypothetical protein